VADASDKPFVLFDDGPSPSLGLPFSTEAVDAYPVVRGVRRVPTIKDVKRYNNARAAARSGAKTADAAADAELAVQNEFYARHVLEWNVTRPNGEAVPVTAETIGRLPPPVWYQLEDVVTGYRGADLPN
jgi:hypothetical protein